MSATGDSKSLRSSLRSHSILHSASSKVRFMQAAAPKFRAKLSCDCVGCIRTNPPEQSLLPPSHFCFLTRYCNTGACHVFLSSHTSCAFISLPSAQLQSVIHWQLYLLAAQQIAAEINRDHICGEPQRVHHFQREVLPVLTKLT